MTWIKGGHDIDPANAISGAADVILSVGRIAAIGRDLAASGGEMIIGATRDALLPRIIDTHAHIIVSHRRSGLSPDLRVNTVSSSETTVAAFQSQIFRLGQTAASL